MAARQHIFGAQLLYNDYLNVVEGEDDLIIQRTNEFMNLSESKFMERYRLSKTVVVKVLEEIQHRLEYPTQRNFPVTPMQQLLLALRFYATGSFHVIVGDIVGISKATACRIVHKVSAAIAALRPYYIVFPEAQERQKIVANFYNIANFPGVVGAIDCTHIKIQSPGGNRSELYRNRKGYFSLNIQTVCDATLLIRDIVARWPGSVHDSTIFNNSRLFAEFETERIQDCLLLGDSGYPLRRYLLTPFLRPEIRSQQNYNSAHIRTRNCIERMYGVWKRRFPVLSMGLRTKVEKSLTIIIATAVLHNIAVLTKDAVPPEDCVLNEYLAEMRNMEPQDVGNVPDIVYNEQRTAAAMRNALAEQHFAW